MIKYLLPFLFLTLLLSCGRQESNPASSTIDTVYVTSNIVTLDTVGVFIPVDTFTMDTLVFFVPVNSVISVSLWKWDEHQQNWQTQWCAYNFEDNILITNYGGISSWKFRCSLIYEVKDGGTN